MQNSSICKKKKKRDNGKCQYGSYRYMCNGGVDKKSLWEEKTVPDVK